MVLPTKAICDYFVNPYGDTAAHLATYIDPSANPQVALDIGSQIALGATVLDDIGSVVGAQARRRCRLSIIQPPLQIGNYNSPKSSKPGEPLPIAPSPVGPPAPCQIGIVSTNAGDTALGAGLRGVTIQATDNNGNPISETIPTSGPVMALSVGKTYNTLLPTSAFSTFGISQGSLGTIYIYFIFDPVAERGRAPQLVACFGESYLQKFGYLSAAPCQNLLTNMLTRLVGPVVPVAPILSI